MTKAWIGGHTFEVQCDMIDVTSMSRPDTDWRYTCRGGGLHAWYRDQAPASSYRPEARYHTPTLRWVHDGWGYYEDGERYEIGHHECAQCGEHITPRRTADTSQQFVPGLRHYFADGVPVSKEEFERIHNAARR